MSFRQGLFEGRVSKEEKLGEGKKVKNLDLLVA